jgi:hypothetical protein
MQPNSRTHELTESGLELLKLKSIPFQATNLETALIKKLIEVANDLRTDTVHYRLVLAAAYDLLLSVEYYRVVTHAGWLYCPNPPENPLLLYPYNANVCPRCVLQNNFHYHKANKPESGVIGQRTARLLALVIKELLLSKERRVEVYKGSEPIDIIFVDHSQTPTAVLLGEIKAAPLVIPSLVAASQRLTSGEEGSVNYESHRSTDKTDLYGSPLGIFVPGRDENKHGWQGRFFELGAISGEDDKTWAYRGLLNLLNSNPLFFASYTDFWIASLEAYRKKDQDSVYWLTNGCGQPSPRPADWPKRKGSGHESISDAKTSVGMDRTDDIKKAIYQVLKIGSETKPSESFDFKVGIISNVHAVRHFDEYFASLEDIIWTRDESGTATVVDQLPSGTALFRLFDGLITLTETVTHDQWIKETFNF